MKHEDIEGVDGWYNPMLWLCLQVWDVRMDDAQVCEIAAPMGDTRAYCARGALSHNTLFSAHGDGRWGTATHSYCIITTLSVRFIIIPLGCTTGGWQSVGRAFTIN